MTFFGMDAAVADYAGDGVFTDVSEATDLQVVIEATGGVPVGKSLALTPACRHRRGHSPSASSSRLRPRCLAGQRPHRKRDRQGRPSLTYRQAQLFWNVGADSVEGFVTVPPETTGDLSRAIVGRGAAYADGDGDLDVVLT